MIKQKQIYLENLNEKIAAKTVPLLSKTATYSYMYIVKPPLVKSPVKQTFHLMHNLEIKLKLYCYIKTFKFCLPIKRQKSVSRGKYQFLLYDSFIKNEKKEAYFIRGTSGVI